MENLDYKKFKLFLMSILWRSAISNLDFFSEIKLAKKKAERLRQMLDSENPGDTYDFCTVAVISKLIGKTFPDIIIQPYPVRFLSYKFYYYVMGGIHWLIFPSKMTKLFPLRNHFVTKNGKMIIQLVRSEGFGSYSDILKGIKYEELISFP